MHTYTYIYLYKHTYIYICMYVCEYTMYTPPKTVLYLIVVGGEQPSRGMPGGAMPLGVKAIG